jgi:nitrite reductase (NADH) large subunit
MTKIVIIGASVAGHSAAVKLREKISDCAITLLTEENFPFYDRRRLPDFLAGTIEEKELFISSEEFYAQNNIIFLKDKKVSSLNPAKRLIYFKERGGEEYDFLLIASGRKVVLPEIPGARRNGVFILYNLEDYKRFREHIRIIRNPVCLLGSDDWALAIAKTIACAHKIEVKLISRNTVENSGLPQDLEVINTPLQEIIGEGEVQAVKLKEGKLIGVSSVVFLEELRNNIDFLKNTQMEISEDTILTDETMRTSIENVFACGAVARRRTESARIKNWDEVAMEAENFADNFLRRMKGETCQTY